MPSPAKKWRLASQRLIDACHEIGVLLLAFAPLDDALDARSFAETWPQMVTFLILGLLFVGLGIYFEWRVNDD